MTDRTPITAESLVACMHTGLPTSGAPDALRPSSERMGLHYTRTRKRMHIGKSKAAYRAMLALTMCHYPCGTSLGTRVRG